MALHKLRDWFIEAKLYLNRTAGYLNIANFLMISLIFINTTAFAAEFANRKLFLAIIFIVLIGFMLLAGWLDTKFKFWQTENIKTQDSSRSPYMSVIAFQCAKMLNELKESGKSTEKLEADLDNIFGKYNLELAFDEFKEATK